MSQLSAFNYIPERSEATPGLWNAPFSILSANIAALNSQLTFAVPSGITLSVATDLNVLGQIHAQGLSLGSTPPSDVTTAAVTIAVNSNQSDYLYLTDSAGQRSSYVIGSRAGGTADGLNIWDASGDTMIVSFSKQSIRFYQNVVGPVFDLGGALASTYNAATFGTGADSTESRIQSAINQASIDGVQRVYLPASMLSFSASSVSFILGVQMVREGGDWSVYDVSAYGVKGNGTDETVAIQSIETVRPVGATVRFLSGKSYLVASSFDGTLAERQKLLKITKAGVWDMRGATLQYGGAVNVTTGSDGAALGGVINVLAGNVDLEGGTLHGNGFARYPLALQGNISNIYLRLSIRSTLTTSSVWPGVQFAVSTDVAGVAVTAARASNVAGVLSRPFCPMMDTLNSISTHRDVTATLLGGTEVVDNATSVALVMNSTQWNVWMHTLGTVGVRTAPNLNEANVPLMDLLVHDLGHNTAECFGNPANVGTAYGLASGVTVGHLLKGGAHSSWYHYNVLSGSTIPPNVNISGGSNVSSGLIWLQGVYYGSDGVVGAPHLAFSSESSLGWYRSAASIMALSYGTLSTPYVSTNTIVPQSGLTVSVSSILLVVGAGQGQTGLSMRNIASTPNHEIRQTAGQLQIIDAGAMVITTTGTGNHMFFQTNASGTNRVIVRSGGTIEIAQPMYLTSGLSVGVGGTVIPAISSMSSLVGAFVVQGSSSSFTGITWAAAGIGDIILCGPFQSGAASSISSGLVPFSHVTVAGQIEFRLSNVSTLVQNQSAQTWVFTRIRPF